MSDQLLNFHDRANKIIETFASGFQKSGLALISFYISAIILKVLGKPQMTNVFTLDASVLSSVFLFFGFVYFLVCRWDLATQRKRFTDNYHDLKRRYTDLLNVQDIQRILNQDREFSTDLQFMNDKMKVYSLMWVVFLSVLFIITWGLFMHYN